jgi:hypothetical protein
MKNFQYSTVTEKATMNSFIFLESIRDHSGDIILGTFVDARIS